MPRKPNSSFQTKILFSVLLRQPRLWRHGYEISKDTALKSGTLYPLLIRLNDQSLLESCWKEPEKPGRPPRHVYRLTPNGLAVAREQTANAAEFVLGHSNGVPA